MRALSASRLSCVLLQLLVVLLLATSSGAAETIENFDGSSLVAAWWGSDSTEPYCYTMDFLSTQHVHSGTHALEVQFDKANDPGNQYSFFSASGYYNLRNYDYLSFWVYNDGSPLWVKIRVEGQAWSNNWESDWAGIEPRTSSPTSDWENLVVDLTRALNDTNLDWTAVRQVIFMVQPGSSNATGTFWLDDIELQRSPGPAPLVVFEVDDEFGWGEGSGFGIGWSSNRFHNEGGTTSLGHHAMTVSWADAAPASTNHVVYQPALKTWQPRDRSGHYPDFTLNGNDAMGVWMWSDTETDMPVRVSFNGAVVGTETYTGNGAWQHLAWDYSGVGQATNVGSVAFTFYPGVGDALGGCCMDDLNLLGGAAPVLPLAPGGLTSTADDPDQDGVYTVLWASVSGAASYDLQESMEPNFINPVSYYPVTPSFTMSKSMLTYEATYYYRVRSNIRTGTNDNFGCFCRPYIVNIRANPAPNQMYEIFDDFDGNGLVGTWWANDPEAPYCYQLDFGNTQQVHSGTCAVRVDYDKANDASNAYSFFSASGQYNLRNFDYLSFWVYNDGSPLWIKIRMEGQSWSNEWETDWAGIVPQTVTTNADWENVVVDLTRTFSCTQLDWTAVRQLIFMIEPGSTNTAGTFWIDDICVQRAPNSAPLETYESDFYGWDCGAPFSLTLSTNTFYNDGTVAGLGHRSLQATWGTKPTNDYSNFTYEPKHDEVAPVDRIGNYTNFRLGANSRFTAWIKSETETNMPILLKFDASDVATRTYTGSGAWQRLEWNYQNIGNAGSVQKVYFMPYPGGGDDGGELFVDNVELMAGSPPLVPLAPRNLRTTAASPDEDGLYTVLWGAITGAVHYQLQEDTDPEFGAPADYYPATNTFDIANSPEEDPVTYYYRVRSIVPDGTNYNYGSYTRPVAAVVRAVPDPVVKFEVVDDFDGHRLAGAWWANDPTEPYCYQMDFGNTQHVRSGTALKVAYDKANDPSNTYSFFSASGHFDFRNYDYMSFWVYNDGSPLWIKIRLEGAVWSNAWESDWAGIFPVMQTPAADWENLVVDLTRTFSETNFDWKDIRQIMFMVQPGTNIGSGTFWMDDIVLRRGPNSAPLDPFESDAYGWAAGDLFALSLATESFHHDTGGAGGLGQRSLKVTWGEKSNDYSNIVYEPRHDAAVAPLHRVGNYPDMSRDGNYLLSAWVRSATETSMPILLKFDSVIADIGVKTYNGTGAWQRLEWNFSSFAGVDDVHQVMFFPYPGSGDDGGTLYLDDVNLLGGMAPVFPTAPKQVASTAMDPDSDGGFTVTWEAVPDATMYEVQESRDPDFSTYTSYYATDAYLEFDKDPIGDAGTWYYRVRANTPCDGEDNYGAFSPVPVAVHISGLPQGVENHSYATDCAEVDNINIPLSKPYATAYRLTAYHPKYFPTSIGERGADFDDCAFTEQTIWEIGTDDGAADEFAQTGFGGADDYYAQDNPAAGIDEPWSSFPKEINRDWMTNQYIWFTADEEADVNLEVKIGARLTVDFTMINGTLALEMLTRGVDGWVNQGTQVFSSVTLTGTWDIADFTWAEGTDTNAVRLHVVQALSSAGAWGVYDALELRKREQLNETVHYGIYNDGNVVVDAVEIDFWWRAPQGMSLTVIGQDTTTNVDGIQYFRITKRVPDTNRVDYSQVFVLYEDGNARIEPHPPAGIDWVPFGASVILGPTEEGARPFAGIDAVTLRAKDLSMDIAYDDGGSAHVEMWVDREQNVVDVSEVTYDTLRYPYARFRSMWVYDGKADIDRVETAEGVFPVTKKWDILYGSWWRFFKEVPTYHNTYCPEFLVETRDGSEAYLTRQAESLDSGSNYVEVNRGNAFGLKAINMSADGGSATFDINLPVTHPETWMIIRYSDDDGGNNGDCRGNLIAVYVDDELKDSTYSMNTGGWDDFEYAPSLYLGDLSSGPHTIRIVTGPLTFGIDLDQFELISRAVSYAEREDVLTRQAESYDAASGLEVTNAAGAEGGQAIALTGQVARFDGPRGVALEGEGILFVADTGNHTIRRSDGIGIVSAFAGLADASGSADGTGQVARFNGPRGVAVNRGLPRRVYVADTDNHTIRWAGLDGAVTTLAGLAGSSGSDDGTGTVARFHAPGALAVDLAGNAYVADTGNHTIRKVGTNGVVTTVAGLAGSPGSADGTGTVARFNGPSGIAVDDNLPPNVYVADTGNHTIRKIDTNGVVSTPAGLAGSSGTADGTGSVARFSAPCGIAAQRSWPRTLYIADTGNHTIREMDTNGVVTTLAGLAGSSGWVNGTGSVARFQYPEAIAVAEAGTLACVAESQQHTVRRIANPPLQVYLGLVRGAVAAFAGDPGVAGEDDVVTGANATYNVSLASACTNAYLSVRYADEAGPNRIEVFVDSAKIGRFPSEHTGSWTGFTESADLYVGDLAAGAHTVQLWPNAGTYGVVIDQFKIFTYTTVVAAAAGRLEYQVDSFSVVEGMDSATITVVRTGGDQGEVGVSFATSNGTATAGLDYTATNGTLTFADGVTSRTFAVSIEDDDEDESPETVFLSLGNPTGGAALGQRRDALLAIMDAPHGELQFAAEMFLAPEPSGVATVTVVRTAGSKGAVSVSYATGDGTAVAEVDYVAATGIVSFADGQTSQTFTVTLLDDVRFERDETVALVLRDPDGGATLGRRDRATLTIVDDELVVPLIIGTNDASAAEFADSGFTNPFYASTMRVGDFPRELGLTSWATQDIVISIDELSASCGLLFTFDVATNNGWGALDIWVHVDNGGGFQSAGAVSVNAATNAHLSIGASLLAEGTNVIRLIAASGSFGTTWVWWDQLTIMPQFYIQHLAYVNGVDYFPQAMAEQSNYTGAASCWMVARYCLGASFTQSQEQIYNANAHDPAHNDEITPASCASWMVNMCYPPYWFSRRTLTNLNLALREMVYWIDYVPPGGTNAPVYIVSGTNWSYKVVRGFQTDQKPYAGSGGSGGSTYSVHGLWVNDPRYNGLGYNIYVVAPEMEFVFKPTDGVGHYEIIVEPPPDPEELARAGLAISNSTCVVAEPEGDAAQAACLQLLLAGRRGGKPGRSSGPARSSGEPGEPSELRNTLPYALLVDPGFMEVFNDSTVYHSYAVNAGMPGSYVLAAGGLRGPGSTVYVFKMDPDDGSLRQATWNTGSAMYPPVPLEGAVWLGRRHLGRPDATFVDARLVFDDDVDASPFFPRWEVQFEVDGQGTNVFVEQTEDLSGDEDGDGMSNLDELYAGQDPDSAASAWTVDGEPEEGATEEHAIIMWSSISNRTYCLHAATNLFSGFSVRAPHIPATPPVNTYTDEISGVRTYYRIEVE